MVVRAKEHSHFGTPHDFNQYRDEAFVLRLQHCFQSRRAKLTIATGEVVHVARSKIVGQLFGILFRGGRVHHGHFRSRCVFGDRCGGLFGGTRTGGQDEKKRSAQQDLRTQGIHLPKCRLQSLNLSYFPFKKKSRPQTNVGGSVGIARAVNLTRGGRRSAIQNPQQATCFHPRAGSCGAAGSWMRPLQLALSKTNLEIPWPRSLLLLSPALAAH